MSIKPMISLSTICCGCKNIQCLFCQCQIKTIVRVRDWGLSSQSSGSSTGLQSDWSKEAVTFLSQSDPLQQGLSSVCQSRSQRSDSRNPTEAHEVVLGSNHDQTICTSDEWQWQWGCQNANSANSEAPVTSGPESLTLEFSTRKPRQSKVTDAESVNQMCAFSEPDMTSASDCAKSGLWGGGKNNKERKVKLTSTQDSDRTDYAVFGNYGDNGDNADNGDCGDYVDVRHLEQAYESFVEPSVRLNHTLACRRHQLLNMQIVRENLRLVKLREHPMQLVTDGQRLVDLGLNSIEQLLRRRAELTKRTIESRVCYPNWLRFRLRVKKKFADLRWKFFVSHRQNLRLEQPYNIEQVADIQDAEKYDPKYIEAWTSSMLVSVRNRASIRDAISAALCRLGLDKRADLRYSVLCFLDDEINRAQKVDETEEPIEVYECTPVRQLYHLNVSEIFINENGRQHFQICRGFSSRHLEINERHEDSDKFDSNEDSSNRSL